MPHFSFASFFSSSVLLFCSENLVIAPHSPSPLFFFFLLLLPSLFRAHTVYTQAHRHTLLFPRKLGESGKIYFLISAWKGNWASSDANWVFAVQYIIRAGPGAVKSDGGGGGSSNLSNLAHNARRREGGGRKRKFSKEMQFSFLARLFFFLLHVAFRCSCVLQGLQAK